MRTRIAIGAVLIAATTLTSVAAGNRAPLPPGRQSAVAYLSEPTLIGATFIVGPVMFTHDDANARGGPCTTVHLFDPASGQATEQIASFHCIPRRGRVAATLTITTRPSSLGFGCVLTSYQFAGDREVHGVPQPADAH
jgi:hypothetical protein